MNREAQLNIELYRRVRGGRQSSLALRKLEGWYNADLAHRMPEAGMTQEELDNEARFILEDLTRIMAGEPCGICKEHLAFSTADQAFLPPTLRDVEEGRRRILYHESCL